MTPRCVNDVYTPTPKLLSVIKGFRTGSIFCVFSHSTYGKGCLTTQSHRSVQTSSDYSQHKAFTIQK